MRIGLLAALAIWLGTACPLRAQAPSWSAPAPYLVLQPDDDPVPHGPGPGEEDKTPCGHSFYGEASYLMAWVKARSAPPLLSSGPNVLLQNVPFDDQQRAGGRFGVGMWLDRRQSFGVEVGGFFLGDRSPTLPVGSAGFTPLAIPFMNAQGVPTTFPVSQPGQFAGTVVFEAPSRFWGTEVGFRKQLLSTVHGYADVVSGFRFLELDEGLHFTASRVALPGGPLAPGSIQAVSDRFGTRNQFYGGYIGAEGELRWRNFFVNALGRVALGSVDQTANVNGTTLTVGPLGARSAAPGGLFAQAGNSGRYEQAEFAVVPEVGVHVGYRLAAQVRLSLGYSLLYLDHAARPGDQMERPVFLFKQSDFWMQALNFGVEFRY
jgi:hypothetical protein